MVELQTAGRVEGGSTDKAKKMNCCDISHGEEGAAVERLMLREGEFNLLKIQHLMSGEALARGHYGPLTTPSRLLFTSHSSFQQKSPRTLPGTAREARASHPVPIWWWVRLLATSPMCT
jgi:hypothetical protein